MVGNEYSIRIYKPLNMSIGTVMRNPEMLMITLKVKQFVNMQLKKKKLLFVIFFKNKNKNIFS